MNPKMLPRTTDTYLHYILLFYKHTIILTNTKSRWLDLASISLTLYPRYMCGAYFPTLSELPVNKTMLTRQTMFTGSIGCG